MVEKFGIQSILLWPTRLPNDSTPFYISHHRNSIWWRPFQYEPNSLLGNSKRQRATLGPKISETHSFSISCMEFSGKMESSFAERDFKTFFF